MKKREGSRGGALRHRIFRFQFDFGVRLFVVVFVRERWGVKKITR